MQFVRFAWRKDTAKRAKILRTVSFPPMLDVRNLCTKELQANIAAHRTALEQERDLASGAKAAAPAAAPADGDVPMPPPPAPSASAAAAAGASSSGAA